LSLYSLHYIDGLGEGLLAEHHHFCNFCNSDNCGCKIRNQRSAACLSEVTLAFAMICEIAPLTLLARVNIKSADRKRRVSI